MNFIMENWGIIASLLLALSEVLAVTPAIKANSVFQLVYGWLKGQKV